MNQETLLRTARDLCQPSSAAAAEFETSRDGLAEELNRRMEARADLERLIGAENLEMMRDNSRNFCRFLSSVFHDYEPEVLVQTVLWVFRAYRSHGFRTSYWPANLDTFVGIARERLSAPTFEAIYPFLHWLIVNIPAFAAISDIQLASPPPSTPPPTPGHERRLQA